jgi:hypothetical protein
MVCTACCERKAKRSCPALGRQICTVCCGTKRQVEIDCPADCVYLTTARVHPPAIVQRQIQQDRALLLPLVTGLTDRQSRTFLLFASVVARHRAEMLHQLVDEDVAQAAEAQAATLETSARGIVYEHRPATVPAERLLAELKALSAEITQQGGSPVERDAAIALRRLQEAARESAKRRPGGRNFQELLARLLAPAPGAPREGPAPAKAAGPPSLIIP